LQSICYALHKLQPGSTLHKKKLKLLKILRKYETRHSAQLHYTLPKQRMELGKKSIEYIGPKIWQEVPIEI